MLFNKFDYATDIFFDLGSLGLLFDLKFKLFSVSEPVSISWFFIQFRQRPRWLQFFREFFCVRVRIHCYSYLSLIAAATVVVNFVHSFSEKKAGNHQSETKSTPAILAKVDLQAIHIFLVYWIFMYVLNTLFNKIFTNKLSIVAAPFRFTQSVGMKMSLFLGGKGGERASKTRRKLLIERIRINWIGVE